MFDKILIANRGEIARRVIRTARRMGVATIAVYSRVDESAAHVREADYAAALSGETPGAGYLDGAQIAACARRLKAAAVHPGCGFLAESAAFARQCAAAKVAFIGPAPQTLAMAATKSAARDLAARNGIPVLPGASGDIKALKSAAHAIGYPLLVKAEAGGGGRGIRLAENAKGLDEALGAAAREAAAGFGDGKILLEKYLPNARHIEVQILADNYGETTHLGERDCSLQRRRQKLAEETPAPRLSKHLRERLCEAAITLAKAARYRGAGTAEFLVSDGAFYFLEINARLQVEHPISEAVSGVDLVEWQLRIAAGERLPPGGFSATASPSKKFAIEARVCAEDARRDFLPAAGKLSRTRIKRGAHLRIDSGAQEGDDIPPDYDSLFAKIITVGDSREQARKRLLRALRGMQIGGVAVNAPYLIALLDTPAFRAGRHTTATVAENTPRIKKELDKQARLLARIAAVYFAAKGGALWAWKINQPRTTQLSLRRSDGEIFHIALAIDADKKTLHLRGDAGGGRYRIIAVSDDFLRVEIAGEMRRFATRGKGDFVEVFADGGGDGFSILRQDSNEAADAAGGGDVISAPMNAKVAAVFVCAGQNIAAGESAAVLETMKMEIALAAPRAGVISAVAVKVGDAVVAGQAVATLVKKDAG